MLAFIVRRSLQAVLVLLVVSLLVFIGVHAISNPVDILINTPVDAQQRARALAALGLEEPLWTQFLVFISGVLHGDLGRSFVHDTPALGLILERMPATLELAIAAMLMAVLLGASPWIVGRIEARQRRRPHHPGRIDSRSLPAGVLGRPAARHGVLGDPGVAACVWQGTDHAPARRPGEFPVAGGLAPSDPAGDQSRPVQSRACSSASPEPAHARHCGRTTSSSRAPRGSPRRA